MKAPEKIYLSDFTDTTEAVFYVKKDNTKKTDVEYTRTDAFIEKACEWLEGAMLIDDIYGVGNNIENLKELINDFKKAMKGGSNDY